MKPWNIIILNIICFFLIINASDVNACSAFQVSKGDITIVGKSFDWGFDHGLIIINQKGLTKSALVKPPQIPANWTSKYGSITFNQVSRELPFSGMNEKGLTVEVLWLETASFPKQDNRPALNELQWAQYQLDQFASVKEVVKHLQDIRILKAVATIHYFVCDALGACATIEPVNEKLVVHSNKSLPIKAITNNTYEDSLRYVEPYLDLKTPKTPPNGDQSLSRFTRLSQFLKTQKNNSTDLISLTNEAFALVKNTTKDYETQWNIVYDLTNKTVHVKTKSKPDEKIINLSRMNFGCDKPLLAMDINDPKKGDITNDFSKYTKDMNKIIVSKSLATGFAHFPPEAIEKIASYPDSEVCKQ